jgi:TIR domain
LAVFGDLTRHGYDVFIDYDGIGSGSFETAILENITARAHFLVLLTPTALERSGDPKDWMRREIETAVESQRNIVPLMLAGFNFSTSVSQAQLVGKLAELRKYNGLPIPEGYFPQAMERLRNKFLNVAVDAILHPASASAQQVATAQKDRATVALGKPATAPSAGEDSFKKGLLPAAWRPEGEEPIAFSQQTLGISQDERPFANYTLSKTRVVIVIGSLIAGIVGTGIWLYNRKEPILGYLTWPLLSRLVSVSKLSD